MEFKGYNFSASNAKTVCAPPVKERKFGWWMIPIAILLIFATVTSYMFINAQIKSLMTLEATEFTDHDVKRLKSIYQIPEKMEITFIKSKDHTSFMGSETFFYIHGKYLDSVKLYIENLLLDDIDWRQCDYTSKFREFVFDDGRSYKLLAHFDYIGETDCFLNIYKPMGLDKVPDKYLVYVSIPATLYTDRMKKSNSDRYDELYRLIL